MDPLYGVSLADLIFTQNFQGKSHLEDISGKPKLIFLIKNFDILKTIEDNWVLAITTPACAMPACPVPPTDIVFALDFHTEVTPQVFERTREMEYVNAAATLDSSWKMINNEFWKVRDFLNKTLDALEISHQHSGDRVAMVLSTVTTRKS